VRPLGFFEARLVWLAMADDYCDLCDLPRSQCIHGLPAPTPASKPAARKKTTRPKPAKRAATTKAPARPRRWTPPEAIRPHVLHVLREAGGELEAEDVFKRLEERMADVLLEADQERTPEGELRWRYAARRARQALIAAGLMAKSRPGVWELTENGLAAE
jgi:Mrr N-terminal domain